MLFNSVSFLVFLPIVFFGYWGFFAKSVRLRNLFIVLVSYVFYGWWDPRFLLLMALTSFVAWGTGFLVARDGATRRVGLVVSLAVNLGILASFKYFDFFVESATAALAVLGVSVHLPTLHILLPVGISFYTFQAIGYTIDVSRRTFQPVRDPLAFFAFISFFPQLVAGPIERAVHLIPQFLERRTFDPDQAVRGCRQMLWGFFKKMVVADGCAGVANAILNGVIYDPGWISYLVAFFCFTIQIYGDFSGYSDIAIGCARLFGFDLMQNFAFPYFSRDIAEFWRRWHISLTTWFRDYLYIPLGGSRCGKGKQIRNTFAIFLVSGLWHGANWTFVLWGFVHACCFLPLLLLGRNRRNLGQAGAGRGLPGFGEALRMAGTFLVALTAWSIFRAESIAQLGAWWRSILSLKGGLRVAAMSGAGDLLPLLPWIGILFGVEWFNRGEAFGCARYPRNRLLRWGCYLALFEAIVFFRGEPTAFIYFRF